jgi:LPS O-antigen subunit length determinant protein (WzzB/FepE family)
VSHLTEEDYYDFLDSIESSKDQKADSLYIDQINKANRLFPFYTQSSEQEKQQSLREQISNSVDTKFQLDSHFSCLYK